METSELEMLKKIHAIFKSKKLKLSVAESCTGGFIGHMITSLSGASEFFDSSVVCYSSESKKKFLGIKKSMIKKYGAVSEETARAMAEAMRLKAGTDYALAITGNLGPAGMENKKAGLVFFAVASDAVTESKGMIFDGSRDEIKQAASLSALEFLCGVVSVWT